MILDWVAQTPALLAAVFVVFLPGLLPLLVIRIRGLALVALAPILGTAVAAGSAILLDWFGIGWTPVSYGVMVVLVTALAWGARLLLGAAPERVRSASPRWFLPAALTAGVVVGAASLAAYIADPTGISQTNDAVFHLNAVRYALDTGSASSLGITTFMTGRTVFYPAAWHALVSMVVLITGAEIAVAANVITLVIGAVIWTAGIAWLTRVATGSTMSAGYAAALSGALQMFPLLMFQWGVLYPNALSVALLPGAIALVLTTPKWLRRDKPVHSVGLLAILIVLSVAALLLSQPASVLIWGLVCAVWFSIHLFRQQAVRSTLARLSVLVLVWAALTVVWIFFAQSTSGSHWPVFRGKFEAGVDVLLNRQMEIPVPYAIVALMLVGLIVVVRRGTLWWIAAAWLAVSALYIGAAAFSAPLVRTWLLGPWYSDPNRVAALAPLLVIPLAAIGLDALVRLILRRGDRIRPFIGFVGALLLIVIVMLTRSTAEPAFTEGRVYEESRYAITEETYLSIDERELLESLPELVPEGERILGNPSAGTGFGYAFSGMDVYPRSWSPPSNQAWTVLAGELRDVASEPAVCEALTAIGSPGYVLDFGPGEVKPGRYVMPGLTDFDGQDGFEFIAAEGEASLWRITACAL